MLCNWVQLPREVREQEQTVIRVNKRVGEYSGKKTASCWYMTFIHTSVVYIVCLSCTRLFSLSFLTDLHHNPLSTCLMRNRTYLIAQQICDVSGKDSFIHFVFFLYFRPWLLLLSTISFLASRGSSFQSELTLRPLVHTTHYSYPKKKLCANRQS